MVRFVTSRGIQISLCFCSTTITKKVKIFRFFFNYSVIFGQKSICFVQKCASQRDESNRVKFFKIGWKINFLSPKSTFFTRLYIYEYSQILHRPFICYLPNKISTFQFFKIKIIPLERARRGLSAPIFSLKNLQK